MSLISDALKKAEQQRIQPALNRVSNWDQSPQPRSQPSGGAMVPRSSSRTMLLANATVLALLCLVAVYIWREPPMAAESQLAAETSPESIDIDATELPAAPAEEVIETLAPTAPLAASPFLQPAATVSTPEPAVTDAYDLGGTSTLGSNTLLSVVRRSDRRSIWIPVGKTIGEVTAVSYDPEKDQAVIRVRGNLLSVSMRQFSDHAEPAAEGEAEAAAE